MLAAGWYFSPEQPFDLVVAQQFNPNPAYVDAIVRNLNFEGGCNPVNVCDVTGLGWKRQREIVDQYSENDRHVLPKDGIPISNIQQGFVWTFTYGYELTPLCFPGDGADVPYPMYDRWAFARNSERNGWAGRKQSFLFVVTGNKLCYGSPMVKTLFKTCAMVAALAAFSSIARAADSSALSLVKEANHYVSDEVKDHVVQIRSEKSIGSLTPIIWYVVFYDPDATFHATEVKFGGGRKLDVKRPMRMLEFGRTDTKVMDMKKIKIDSDKAISIATEDPLLKGLTIKATQLWLEKGNGDVPEWRVRLWAAKLRNPNDEADIGEVHIQATDGTVTTRDLHINRVD